MYPILEIEAVRRAALHLHRVLIEAVRLDYEREHGRIENPVELLRLVAYDPQFAWLRPLSRLLVELDEAPEAGAKDAKGAKGYRDAVMAAVLGDEQTMVSDSNDGEPVDGPTDAAELFAAANGDDQLVAVRVGVERLFEDPEWTGPYLQVLQDVPEAVIAHAHLQRELARLPVTDSAREPELLS